MSPSLLPLPQGPVAGGGWGCPDGSTRRQTAFYRQCAHLATRGMVAASCSYKVEPLRSPPPPWIRDAGVVEGAAAVAYLREHAAELNVDASRVANGGGSAGGYVAAGAAFVPLGVGGPGGRGTNPRPGGAPPRHAAAPGLGVAGAHRPTAGGGRGAPRPHAAGAVAPRPRL